MLHGHAGKIGTRLQTGFARVSHVCTWHERRAAPVMGCGVGRLWVFLVGAVCLLGTRAAALGVVERLIVIRDQLEVRRTDFIISAIQQIDDIIAELSLSDPVLMTCECWLVGIV